MKLRDTLLIACSAFAMMLASSASGQIWNEIGDAPDGVPARQDTLGSGPLTNINGAIDRGIEDHVDTYSIIITDPSAFWATTNPTLGNLTGTANGGDSRLWLWDEAGNILLGNDDAGPTGFQSAITDPTTYTAFTGGDVVDPTAVGVVLNAGQKYLLSISYFPNDPDDAAGVDLANMGADFDALHGANPAAGAFAAWENTAGTTAFAYSIELNGATFCAVPEPTSLAFLGFGSLALCGLRRRKQA